MDVYDAFIAGSKTYRLSEREIEVMWRMFLGDTSQEAANELGVSQSTIHAHLKNVSHKTKERKITKNISKLLGAT